MSDGAGPVLVTGGSGFVGSHIVAALNEAGVRPRVLMRGDTAPPALADRSFEAVSGDITSPETLAPALVGADTVFHVAAVSDYWRQPVDRLYKTNVTGTRDLLDAALAAGVRRFVFTSSMAALGVPSGDEQLTEAHEFNLPPSSFPYAHSKHLAEIEVRRAAARGLEAVIVNPTVVLGPNDVNQVSGSIVVEAARGMALFRPPGGTNFVHVSDVAAGHLAAAQVGRVGERYILGGVNLLHAEALDIVCEALGRRGPLLPLPLPLVPIMAGIVALARRLLGARVPLDANQVRISGLMLFADTSKARRELDLPQTPFRQMVEETVAWYRAAGSI